MSNQQNNQSDIDAWINAGLIVADGKPVCVGKRPELTLEDLDELERGICGGRTPPPKESTPSK